MTMTRKLLYLFPLVLLVSLLGCGAVPVDSLSLQYTMEECDQSPGALEKESHVEITVQDGVIHISQDVNYVCCAEFGLNLEQDGDLIKIIETNEGEICRCMCRYHIDAQVSGLSRGTWWVEVWGVQYEDVHPLELLGKAEVDL